ncbi:MAG: MarR family transcriptional regulator [Alphaproteobacteria bacterium]|nr:MAG: MarR family transcriptional regulator [Alphaproteobacteria bacterium]
MPEVTPTQFAVLAKLAEVGELSQNHLGREVGMDAATTKGVVERLRAKGFVNLRPSETDQRRVMISLSDEGARFARDAIVIARRISRLTAANLTPRELARLNSLLDKL